MDATFRSKSAKLVEAALDLAIDLAEKHDFTIEIGRVSWLGKDTYRIL